jgi:hypothetical protein
MASGHVNRIYRPNTWLHRPILQNVKKALANTEPSTHGRFCCRNQDADGAGRLVPFLKPSVVTRGIVRATYARLY